MTGLLHPAYIKFAVFYTKLHSRLFCPRVAADQLQAPPNCGRPWTP